jgi:hypothetical protein
MLPISEHPPPATAATAHGAYQMRAMLLYQVLAARGERWRAARNWDHDELVRVLPHLSPPAIFVFKSYELGEPIVLAAQPGGGFKSARLMRRD